MKVRVKDLYKYIFLFTIFYMYTKTFWDTYLGPVGKVLFYGSVFLGIMSFFIDILFRPKGRNLLIVLGFTIYGIYIVLNGKILSNEAQFSQGMLEYILYTFYFLSSYYYIKKGKIKENAFKGFIYLGSGLSLLALYEYISRTSLIPDDTYSVYYFEGGYSSFRARVFCESPLTFCMMLGILFLFSTYLIIIKKNKQMSIPTILLLVGMFCTGSRGPLIGTLCGAVTIICLTWRAEPLTRKRAEKFLIGFWIAIAAVMIIAVAGEAGMIHTGITSIDNIIKRFSSSFDFTNEWGNVARLRIWTRYIEIFKQHFWIGIGIAQTSSTVLTNTLTVTESGLLKRLVETGFLGTILYLALVCLPIIMIVCKKSSDHHTEDYKKLAIGLFVAVGIEDIVLQLFADVMSMYVFWSFIAMAYYLNMSNTVRKEIGG
nr:O-antigen ligase family protein [uncultured Anaerostipes sp.]